MGERETVPVALEKGEKVVRRTDGVKFKTYKPRVGLWDRDILLHTTGILLLTDRRLIHYATLPPDARGHVFELSLSDISADGTFSYVWTPTEAGSFLVKAFWPGNDDYHGTESSTVSLEVKVAGMGFLTIALGVGGIIIVAAAIYFLRRRKIPPPHPVPTPIVVKECPWCGAKVPTGAVFCPACGRKVK